MAILLFLFLTRSKLSLPASSTCFQGDENEGEIGAKCKEEERKEEDNPPAAPDIAMDEQEEDPRKSDDAAVEEAVERVIGSKTKDRATMEF